MFMLISFTVNMLYHMYVRMYACMHVNLFACIYVCSTKTPGVNAYRTIIARYSMYNA